MNREDRAKQFLPFDALKGLQEALRQREEEALRTERRQLSEEEAEKLSRRLTRLRRGDRVKFAYYDGGHYRHLTAAVLSVDLFRQLLSVNEEESKREIFFADIFSLQIC